MPQNPAQPPLQPLNILSGITRVIISKIALFCFHPIVIYFVVNLFWLAVGIFAFTALEGRGEEESCEMIRIANFVGYKRPGYKKITKLNPTYFMAFAYLHNNGTNKDDLRLLESDLNDPKNLQKLKYLIENFWKSCLTDYFVFKVFSLLLLVLFVYLNERSRFGFLFKSDPLFFTLAACNAYFDDVMHNASQERPSDYFRRGRAIFGSVLYLGYYLILRFLIATVIRTWL